MVALLAKTIEETGWFVSPFERHFEATTAACSSTISGRDHFRDALGDETVSGEANIWPFYTGSWPTRSASRPPFATSMPTASATIPLRYETQPATRA
jgi:hypothetical protein